MVSAPAPPITPEQFLDREEYIGYELVDGVPLERNVSRGSSHVGLWIGRVLLNHVVAHQLGEAYASDLGIQIFADQPNMIRKADVSFLRAERVPPGDSGYLMIPPDLVVEVVSPNDEMSVVRAKVDLWLGAGVSTVWVALPESVELLVFRSGGHPQLLTADDELDASDIVPGFRVPVRDLFPA